MHDLAMKVGLVAPKSWYLKNGDALPIDVEFPCISKPCSSIIGAVGTYTVFLYLYVPTIYTVGTYTIFPCFYVPLSFSVGIFQLSFCTYVPLSLFDGISQLSFCAYVPFSLFAGILQLPFLHMSLLFIQSGFITGNNDFPCMFHLLFGRRLHIFQRIRNPKFFPFKYPQRVIWQNFHTFHGF